MSRSAPDRMPTTAQDTQAQGVLGRWLREREDLTTRLCALATTLAPHAPPETPARTRLLLRSAG